MTRATQALLALIVMNFIYGINYPIAKGLLEETIKPSGFILLRDLGAVVLFTLVAWRTVKEIALRDIGRLAVCAIFGIAVNQLGFFHGLSLSSAINGGIIMTMTPIMVLIMSAIILKERITSNKAIGIVLGAVGALLIVINSGQASDISAAKGDIFLLINAISYGLFLVLVKPLMSKYNPLSIALVLFAFGTIYVAPFGTQDLLEVDFTALSGAALFGLSFVVIGSTFLAYLLNMLALRDVNPSVVAAFIYLQPLLAVVFSWLFGNYAPAELGGGLNHFAAFTWQTLSAALLIFVGVYLVALADLRKKPTAGV